MHGEQQKTLNISFLPKSSWRIGKPLQSQVPVPSVHKAYLKMRV